MESEKELIDRLRAFVVGRMHVGQLRPGDRVPSIREVSRETGVDHRAVARAYDELAREGLVEVRGRSGVYVRPADSARSNLAAGRRHWMSQLMLAGWNQRITLAESSALLSRCANHGLSCLCLESTQDHLVALSSELASDFGLRIVQQQVSVSSMMPEEMLKELRAQIGSVDFVVTTAFHASAITQLVGGARPVITVVVNPAMREEIKRRVQEPVTVVVADPLFRDRIQEFAHGFPGRGVGLRILLASEANPAELSDESTLFTRAARRQLGVAEYHLLTGNIPFLAPESAHAVCDTIVQLALTEES